MDVGFFIKTREMVYTFDDIEWGARCLVFRGMESIDWKQAGN